MSNLKPKHTPERRCTGCGERFQKNELIRIVRTPDGEIVLDTTGRAAGRGAYICRSAACLKKAIKASRIERSLECSVPKEVYERLEAQINNVLQ